MPEIPSYNSFKSNSEYIRPLKNKQITVAEYITDPIILYVSLWGLSGLTMPLWEQPSPYFSTDQFINRLKMEPFATGRIDSVTKPVLDFDGNEQKDQWGNVKTTLKGDFYAKNLIEPFYFTEMALYLRSKNYNPAIVIVELFALSCLYEFTIKPFYKDSSFEQLFKNPSVAIVCGILLDELSAYLLSTPYIGLHVLAYILNPFNALPTARIHSLLFFDYYRKAASIEGIINL